MTENESTPIDEAKKLLEDTDSSTIASAATKTVAKALVGHSIRFAVSGALAAVVPVENRRDKIRLAVASYAISGIITERAQKNVSKSIEEKFEYYRKVRAAVRASDKANDSPNENDVHVVTDL